ncbi:MAG TPA: hypothetical protein VN289_23230 [Paraburkholderia sp.]|jgi:hypothetical protein|nr:hypothetical protein [Paraburkholderia sp.]
MQNEIDEIYLHCCVDNPTDQAAVPMAARTFDTALKGFTQPSSTRDGIAASSRISPGRSGSGILYASRVQAPGGEGRGHYNVSEIPPNQGDRET